MFNGIKIGIIRDFDAIKPSHGATDEALEHCAYTLSINIKYSWLPTEYSLILAFLKAAEEFRTSSH